MLVAEPDSGEIKDPGESGELLTRGPQVFKGYGEVAGVRYLRTGDIACRNEEGYFFMADRLKRMINVSGFKVWPAEVENMSIPPSPKHV